jgi:hypothetical protein
MIKHTPTPWRVIEDTSGKGEISHFIIEGDVDPGDTIGGVFYTNDSESNAVFIVHACNCHDELVGALDNISLQLGRAFTDILQGDYRLIDEMAHHNEIYHDEHGEPKVKIAALINARKE